MANKRNLYAALTALFTAILLVIYYQYNPTKYRFFPPCPFHSITGFDCPGCGSQRALYSLLHGNIKQAADYNLLMVLSVPFLLIHFSYKLRSLIFKKDIHWSLIHHPLTPKVIFILVIIFWITRNIPYTPFSYLSANH